MDFYKRPVEEIFSDLGTTAKGLSSQKAQALKEKYGNNALETKSKVNPLKIFIEQFKSFIIYILIFAVVFSILMGEVVDSVIILIILIANALIGFFQEYGAQKSLESLRKMTAIKAKVLRDSKVIQIDSKELVLGDVVKLEAGDKVPADCRIIESTRLEVEESSLTGESLPVDKDNKPIQKDAPISDQKNMLFSSTAVVGGNAKAVVVKTGMDTEIGKITEMIEETEEEMTPLQKRLDAFGKRLGVGIILICFIILFSSIAKELFTATLTTESFIDFAFIAVSLAVAAVPTALPAVVTIALSIGVKRLLKKKALVRKLSSVETLGSCDIICTDKTGTLTKNEMTVRKAWTLKAESDVTGSGYSPEGKVTNKIDPFLFEIGASCNDATVYQEKRRWNITGDPTEAALVVSAKKAGLQDDTKKRLDELPFDSDRKMMSVLLQDKKQKIMYTKGATDELLKKCTYALIGGRKVKLTKTHIKKIHEQNIHYSSSALRVLSFAYKTVKDKKAFKENDLVFVGLQAMIDPARPEVIDSIKKTEQAGIRVIMITGDYKETAQAIGKEIGITGKVLAGSEIDTMKDEELTKALVDGTNIFARVIPEHKQRIVRSLQNLGHTVSMTGDGVNDAAALKKSNIGVAVGSGTEVAKEASDFVLLDDSFSNIVGAVEQGRGIYDNIQKSIMLLLSGNLGEVLIIFLAVMFGFNLPLTAVLLLWINLITDGMPALAYSVDPYGKNIMKKRPRPKKEGILPEPKFWLIGFLGVIGTAIALTMFYLMGGNSAEQSMIRLAQTMVFNFVVLYELILVFIIRKDYDVPLFTNMWLWMAVFASIALQGLLMYTPLHRFFEITPLGFSELGYLVLSGIVFYMLSMLYYLTGHKLLKKRYEAINP